MARRRESHGQATPTGPTEEQSISGRQRLEARMAARETAGQPGAFPTARPAPTQLAEPLYFPPQKESATEWPPLSPDLMERLEEFEYDEPFFDPRRPAFESRILTIGKTSIRRKDLFKTFRPKEGDIIRESVEEPPVSPRTYGVPRQPSPVRPPMAYQPRVPSPATGQGLTIPGRVPGPEDIFGQPYVPPMYESPEHRIFDESPPLIHEDEEHDIRRDLVMDETKEPQPLSVREMMRRRKMRTAAVSEEFDRLISREPPRRRVMPAQTSPGTPEQVIPQRITPQQPSPEPFIAPTPRLERRRVLPSHHPLGAQRPRRTSRLIEGAGGRRIDFDTRDPDEVTEADRYIAGVIDRSRLPPLTPPEQLPPEQPSILDQMVPSNLPSPMRPPVIVPGWKTPPRLSRKAKTPSPYQVVQPQIDPDQWFFDRPEEPPLAPSPEHIPEYVFGTAERPEDELFFDKVGDMSLASSGGGLSPVALPERPAGSRRHIPSPPPILLPEDDPDLYFFDMPQDQLSPLPDLGKSPEFYPQLPPMAQTPEHLPQRAPSRQGLMETPPRASPSPLSPLGDFPGYIFTPSPGRRERTPVTRADQIFREAGFVDSPIPMVPIEPTPPSPLSPLSDPLEMQRMMERVGEAEGRRAIQRIRTEGRTAQEPPGARQMAELRETIQRRRESDERRRSRRQERDQRKKPSMPSIQESPLPLHVSRPAPIPQDVDEFGFPFLQRVPSPEMWSDRYTSPRRRQAARRQVDYGDEMQTVIDDIVHGRMAQLDVVEVPPDMSPPFPSATTNRIWI
ncbi:hypothetical protein JTB14_013966 [Gonioctena quinquepunctata]|nr:hypothetical protein JTB14_013966 [Gonioctena quinquepunctata]